MKHFRITIEGQPMTAQSAFTANLAALLIRAGASVSVEQESGKFTSAARMEKLIPMEAATPDTEVMIFLKGQ